MANQPPGWGDDPVSDFLRQAHEHSLACFANMPDYFRRVMGIDAIFRKIIPFFGTTEDWLQSFFLLQAHSCYLTSVRLATGGHVAPSYPVIRLCLESSLYGLHIFKNPESAMCWFERGESAQARTQVRQEFSTNQVLSTLRSEDPNLGEILGELYERTIDRGAHPNVEAFLANMDVAEVEEGIRVQLHYLSGPNQSLSLCLKTVLQSGVAALKIFGLIVPQRFAILGVDDSLEKASRGL